MARKFRLLVKTFSRYKLADDGIELELLKLLGQEEVVKEINENELEKSLESIALSILGTKPDVDLVELEAKVDGSTYVFSTSRFASKDLEPVLVAPRPSRILRLYISDATSNTNEVPLKILVNESKGLYVYETPIKVKDPEIEGKILIAECDTGTYIVDLSTIPRIVTKRNTAQTTRRKRKRRRRKRRIKKKKTTKTSA
ncbi:MAG: hypothetical protein DRO12_01905 [Thermoprotei archaeon]|nr:MAG: hypothetical protein DRO12_01905 [Thermoprotei archaeon]